MSPALPVVSRKLPRAALTFSELGLGCAALGNLYEPVTEAAADAAIATAYAAGIRYFDVAPLYGHGLAELRVGAAIRRLGDVELTLSTKVGWRLRAAFDGRAGAEPFKNISAFSRYADYSYDGAMRSIEDSMQRLGTNRLDIAFIHDVDRRTQGDRYHATFDAAMSGAYRALDALRRDGIIKAIGVGVNEWEPCQAFAEAGEFDCFLLAGRYTLLEQQALDTFLPLCQRRGIGVVLGGVYNSGILATGSSTDAKYDYARAPESVMDRVRSLERVCAVHGVPLKAAALQFPLLHHAVVSVIPGARSAAEVEDNLRMLHARIPDQLWTDLRDEGLLRTDAPTLSH